MGRGTSVTIVKLKNFFWEGEKERARECLQREQRMGLSPWKGQPGGLCSQSPPIPHGCPFCPPHLGCTTKVVVVYLLDGLEIDDPLQFRLMLVCKESKGQAEEACHTSDHAVLTWSSSVGEIEWFPGFQNRTQHGALKIYVQCSGHSEYYRERKLGLHWDTTSHLSEWQKYTKDI